MNKRQEIVDALQIRLKAIFDPLSIPVYRQRFLPTSILPVVIIYASGDTSEKAIPESHNVRTENVSIVISCAGKEDYEIVPGGQSVSEIINGYTKLVETDLNKRRETLGDVVHRLNYAASDLTYKTEDEEVIAIAVLRYNAIYMELFAS